jgi:pimeloyl-ACP methyl ester carboxylesterase
MIRDGKSGPWRLPYTLARLHRLRAFTASPANNYNLFAKASAVHCPVLVFRGGMSKRFPPDAEQPFLETFASKPKVVVCSNSGHFPTATERNIIVEGLMRFVRGVR